MVTTLSTESIEAFRTWLLDRGRSPLTVKAYASDLTAVLIRYQSESFKFSEQDLMEFLNSDRHKSSPATVVRRIATFRTFAKFCGIPGDFLTDYKPPKIAEAEPHPLAGGIADVRAMISIAMQTNRWPLVKVIGLCGLAGLRVSEAVAAKPEDLKVDGTLYVVGKGARARNVPISDELLDLLINSGDDPITGQPFSSLSNGYAREAIAIIGEKALGKRVPSHDLRATFATALYEKTKDIRLVQSILGHSDPKTTMIYIKVSLDAKRAAVNFDE